MNGLRWLTGLDAVRPEGDFMTYEKLALLKSLALRPSLSLAPNMKAMADELHSSGFVTYGPEGWLASAEGCNVLERHRTNSADRRPMEKFVS